MSKYLYAYVIDQTTLVKLGASLKTIDKPADVTVYQIATTYQQVVVSPKRHLLVQTLYESGLIAAIDPEKGIKRVNADIVTNLDLLLKELNKGKPEVVQIPIFKEL